MSAAHLRYFRVWLTLGYLILLLIVYLSLTSHPPDLTSIQFGDKIAHLLAYGVLMGWFGQLYTTFRQQVFCALMFCLLGLSMEYLQGMSQVRQFDVVDMLANSLGVILGWGLTVTLFKGTFLWFESKVYSER